jgi:GNAT superfamily N-acetyltransferase
MAVSIRSAVVSDREGILALVPRLRAFGPVPLRSAEQLDAAESAALARALESAGDNHLVLVADDTSIGVVGVAYAHESVDYFTHETHGHLGILAVAESVAGHGVGRALIEAVEAWSVSRNHRFLTLNVFAGNERARHVYERAGFTADTIKLFKQLRRD